MGKEINKYSKSWELDTWDFVQGKNPIGEMATVHIPIDKVIWFAHSANERLDVGLVGSVIHLLQRDSNKDAASKTEKSRAVFNRVGPAYWVEEDVAELYAVLKVERDLRNKFRKPEDIAKVVELSEV